MEAQITTGSTIEAIVRNFKKDSAVRKTVEYYEERLKRMDKAWLDFETTDHKIRCLEQVPLNHEYFVNNYYDKISELVAKYKEIFEAALISPSTEAPREEGQQELSKHYNASKATTTIISAIRRLLQLYPQYGDKMS